MGVGAKALVAELLKNPTQNVNNVASLLSLLRQGCDQDEVREAIRGLKMFFLDAFHKHGLSSTCKAAPKLDKGSNTDSSASTVFTAWLSRQYAACQSKLLSLMAHPATPATVQVEALMAIMEFVRGEVVGSFQNELYTSMLSSVIRSAAFSEIFLGALSNKFLQFADVRYYTLQAVRKVARSLAPHMAASELGSGEEEDNTDRDCGQPAGGGDLGAAASRIPASDVARNCFDLLTTVPASIGPQNTKLTERQLLLLKALGGTAPQDQKLLSWCGALESNLVQAAPGKSESASKRRKRKRAAEAAGAQPAAAGATATKAEARQWANLKLQKKAYSSAWLAFLQMSLPEDIYIKVLTKIHGTVLPNMADPLLLSDFLTASLDKGGLTAVLALNGLFDLVTKHGLEYPHFYKRLYGLLQPEVFRAKHRVEFFRLVDLFLASGLVPAYTAAAYAKRFARLALKTTPPGAMVALGFIHNLIRRHPSCMVLLHRPNATGELASGTDVYLEDCDDPAESRAIESTLWEVATLQNHYFPGVAQMAAMLLEKDLTDRKKTAEINMALLTGESYSSLMKAELKRRLKRVPVAFYSHPPTKLFDAHCKDDFVGWIECDTAGGQQA